MEARFWFQRWKDNEIGFHTSEVNPMLVNYFKSLRLAEGSRVFVPLCGKTLDIGWLLASGYCVVGAELSELAVKQLFIGLELEPSVSEFDEVKRYSANNIDIFVGNIFTLTSTMLGPVNAIYDRAALVALPEATRYRYAAHLMVVTNKAPQLLISYTYDQSLMEGPPFSVTNHEVSQHYNGSYDLTLVESTDIPGGLKGKCAAKENVWLLQKG